MTQNDPKHPRQRATAETAEIVLLLPWYAAGTLGRRDRQRVEAVLRQFPELTGQVDLVREELAETIHLNETLGAPSPAVAERLMAAIDAESGAARKRVPGAAAGWLTGFFASLSPRTMAVAASFAMLAVGLQAVMLADFLSKPQNSQSPESEPVTRGLIPEPAGTFAMVRFAPQTSAAEITNFLQSYQAAVVNGPTAGGLYRVRVAVKALAKEELGHIVARMRRDRIVEFAAADESDR